jgi:HrpA-like RNA helicase
VLELIILPIYSAFITEMQTHIFELPPLGVKKVVVVIGH